MKTEIDFIKDIPWGTHICQFYQTKKDLIDILIPYFRIGLENNEFCMWVTSKPLTEREAKEAMKKAIPNFDQYLQRGQIEIIPSALWYLKDGNFNLQRVLNSFIDKLNQALAKSYEGMRVAGNTSWLEKREWRKFVDYEAEVSKKISNYRMIAVCSYSLDKCEASEIIDAVSSHQFALNRREGKWEIIENVEHKRIDDVLCKSEKHCVSICKTVIDDYAKKRQVQLDHSSQELLSSREREILQFVVEGKTSKEIADILLLSPKTMETYRSRLMNKLGVRGLPSLVKFAIQHGLTPIK